MRPIDTPADTPADTPDEERRRDQMRRNQAVIDHLGAWEHDT